MSKNLWGVDMIKIKINPNVHWTVKAMTHCSSADIWG